MKRAVAAKIIAGLALVCLLGPGAAGAAEVKRYVMGTGPMGGPWRVGVGAGAQMINEQLKEKYFFTAAASGGAVENMRRLISGEFQTAWVYLNHMLEAWTGTGLFEGQKPFKDFRALEYLADQGVCVATLAKSPIRSFADLAGKRVNVGPAGSGGVPVAKDILKAVGVLDKVKLVNITVEAGAQSLKDGQVDASMTPGGPYLPPAILEISRSSPLRLVEPSAEEIKKIEEHLSYFHLGSIPPNKAPGENADRARKMFFWSMYWVALESMPADVIYDVLKMTQEPKNKEVLGKVLNYWTTAGPEFASLARIGIPLHPGAVKFWKEQGVKIPPEIVK